MLNESDFKQMIAEVQDHLDKVIGIYAGIVNDLDDERLRLQYMALYQAKQRHRDALAALVSIVSPSGDSPASGAGEFRK